MRLTFQTICLLAALFTISTHAFENPQHEAELLPPSPSGVAILDANA